MNNTLLSHAPFVINVNQVAPLQTTICIISVFKESTKIHTKKRSHNKMRTKKIKQNKNTNNYPKYQHDWQQEVSLKLKLYLSQGEAEKK